MCGASPIYYLQCHKGGRLVHPVPCCEPCPYCGKMIARGLLNQHEPHCKEKGKKTKA